MRLSFPARVLAQTLFSITYLSVPAMPQTTPPTACSAAEHRQFDFWIGEWQVKTPDGRVAGTNRIERIAGGCGLLENWTGARGMSGKSLNFWRPADRRWHQVWVGGDGTLLELAGGLEDGAMVMQGATPDSGGVTTQHRITWSRLDDGRVRQHWQTSSDQGATWADAFVGYYERVNAKKRP